MPSTPKSGHKALLMAPGGSRPSTRDVWHPPPCKFRRRPTSETYPRDLARNSARLPSLERRLAPRRRGVHVVGSLWQQRVGKIGRMVNRGGRD